MAKTISILVPTYNEEENVVPLAEAIIELFHRELMPRYQYELVFIDNDSKDGTRNQLRMLCNKDSQIKAIFNAKNFEIGRASCRERV